MKRIFLVRHGESEGNADKSIHLRVADHAIHLTSKGRGQAFQAGQFLAGYLNGLRNEAMYGLPRHSGIVRDYVRKTPAFEAYQTQYAFPELPVLCRLWFSPYQRTIETKDSLREGICSEIDIRKHVIDSREHVLLGEQQFGLFDGLSDEELLEQYPAEQAHYQKQEDFSGRFWARMPMGESRFDVAQRVQQSFGTFHRDEDKHGIQNIIVVAHGVTIRAFVMMWCHKSVEWFEHERNPKNCSIRLIEDNEDRGYIYAGFDR